MQRNCRSQAFAGSKIGHTAARHAVGTSTRESSLRIAVKNSSPMRTNVHSPVLLGVARDLQHQTPLMRIVIAPLPVFTFVYSPEDACLPLHRPDEVQRCTRVMWSGLAQTKSMDLIHARHALKEYVLR